MLFKNGFRDAVRSVTKSHAAFDLKGVVAPLTVLRVKSKDLNMIDRQLRAKVAQMPQFFEDAPIVIDLGGLEGDLKGFHLDALVHALRVSGVWPVGAQNVPDDFRAQVKAAGLGILPVGAGKPREIPDEDITVQTAAPTGEMEQGHAQGHAHAQAQVPASPPPIPSSLGNHRPPMVIRQAVRSGQEIYAKKTDMIVLAPVNPGAQIYADGHIHIYAPLRGRAMAGAQGLPDARIFCQRLEAELVSIAGAYVMADEIPEDRRGKPSQVFLENGECRVSAI